LLRKALFWLIMRRIKGFKVHKQNFHTITGSCTLYSTSSISQSRGTSLSISQV
jgi:hypothetical protein